jgi:hypothetical protein
VATSIEEARIEVQQAFASLLAKAESAERRTLVAFEAETWGALLAIGRMLMTIFMMRQANLPRPAVYAVRDVLYLLKGVRTSEVGTLFGKVSFTRPIGRRRGATRAKADLPIDRDLGLCSGFSLGVVSGIARLAAQMPFEQVRSLWRETYAWAPAPLSILRMVDAVGDLARPYLEQTEAPDDDGEVLVIQVDGKGAPMITSDEYALRARPHACAKDDTTARQRRRVRRQDAAKPRRTSGKKSKNSKVAIVGVIYTLRRTAKGFDGPVNKRICATFESHHALFDWLTVEATKRGYGTKRTLFIADGSEHIWRNQARCFPNAEVCLDWYHLAERLWEAGQCFHKSGTPALKAWVADMADAMKKGAIDTVTTTLAQGLASIPKTGPGNKGRRERLSAQLRFIENNRPRLRYEQMRREDLVIGSGAVEGAVRHLIGMRLDGPGARWGRQRSERILHLRCILINRQWSGFTEYLQELERLVLPSKPERARTHDAKAAA